MIMTKQDYQYYLEADRIASHRDIHLNFRSKLIQKFIDPDYVWEFQKLLRKIEYLTNKKRNIFDTINLAIQTRRFKMLSAHLGFFINPNNFGPGLYITHPGTIIVNGNARIGANCAIYNCVIIGFEPSFMNGRAPQIGNNVYIGPGTHIFGSITIANDIAIGANSVVNKSFTEPGVTIAGSPAKVISKKGSKSLIKNATEILEKSRGKIEL
jgi:serine O-acetyltransferase